MPADYDWNSAVGRRSSRRKDFLGSKVYWNAFRTRDIPWKVFFWLRLLELIMNFPWKQHGWGSFCGAESSCKGCVNKCRHQVLAPIDFKRVISHSKALSMSWKRRLRHSTRYDTCSRFRSRNELAKKWGETIKTFFGERSGERTRKRVRKSNSGKFWGG